MLLGHIFSLRTTADATLRTGAYLDATINVERAVVDAETGLRGYVITTKPLFLAPTRTAQAELPGAARALELAANDEGAFVTRATALADAARSYMSSYVPRVTQEVTTDPNAGALGPDDDARKAARRRDPVPDRRARAADLGAPGRTPALRS